MVTSGPWCGGEMEYMDGSTRVKVRVRMELVGAEVGDASSSTLLS